MTRLRHRLALVLLRLATRLLRGHTVTGAHGSTSTSSSGRPRFSGHSGRWASEAEILDAESNTATTAGHIHWGS